ncbi:MAG: type II toxin-antitoxin system PemK/MazF family toxin [bacterium]
MRSTIHFKKWEIILVPFPFTDLSATKKRPLLIISPDEFNSSEDLVIAFITSNISDQLRIGDCLINEWKSSGLPKPSIIRMKFTTISKSIIVKKIGELSEMDRNIFQIKLSKFFSK